MDNGNYNEAEKYFIEAIKVSASIHLGQNRLRYTVHTRTMLVDWSSCSCLRGDSCF